jgi:hypothetical protein
VLVGFDGPVELVARPIDDDLGCFGRDIDDEGGERLAVDDLLPRRPAQRYGSRWSGVISRCAQAMGVTDARR